MKGFHVQLLDGSVPSAWWKKLIEHVAKVGDLVTIRCWKEETAEIASASRYGVATEDGCEVCVQGVFTEALRKELLADPPSDGTPWHKMTQYFTIGLKNDLYELSSEHYGTELFIVMAHDEDVAWFQQLLEQYPGKFSVGTI